MPLVAYSPLPTFERLRTEGELILDPEVFRADPIDELHIGLLNMMPDGALAATERQFFRLIGESNQIIRLYVHPFTLPQISRSTEASAYVSQYYESFSDIQRNGLDALIVTGANPLQSDLSRESFWQPLIEVVGWALDNVNSILCSCLATHAVMQFRYGQKRRRMPSKKWGVYHHRVVNRYHPLVAGVNTSFDVPHSRFNLLDRTQFEAAGMDIIAESDTAGVHLAASHDDMRVVMFQGHPEYDTISLLKEYKREVARFAAGDRDIYPPYPENYLGERARALFDEYRVRVIDACEENRPIPEFPEQLVADTIENTWHDSAEAVVGNWVSQVYQMSSQKRSNLLGYEK